PNLPDFAGGEIEPATIRVVLFPGGEDVESWCDHSDGPHPVRVLGGPGGDVEATHGVPGQVDCAGGAYEVVDQVGDCAEGATVAVGGAGGVCPCGSSPGGVDGVSGRDEGGVQPGGGACEACSGGGPGCV